MTKKLATLVAMLACCVFGALAQRVATTPVTDVQTGDYLLLVHSDKTAADGSWAYINTSNKNSVSTDAASLGTTAYAGSKIENSAYIWHVKKQSDGKITIQSVAQKTYWPTAGGKNESDYYPAHITTGSSANANAFELIALSDGFALKTTTTKKAKFVWEKDAVLTAYVVNNDNSRIGYYGGYDDSKIESKNEIARVEFYPLQAFTELTYNYVFDGEVRTSVKVNAVDGEEYPTPTTAISLPDFIAAPTLKPEGIYHDGAATSYNLQLASTLPFTLSTDANRVYYYLAAGAGTEGRTMLYANGKDLKLRAEAQADNLTAMRNDLWYVTGNPYDGLKFHNVGSGTTAVSSIALSTATELELLGIGNDTWKIYKISDKSFGLYAKDWKKTNVAWKLNGSKVSFEKIDANAPNTSDAFAFQAIEATYVLPLHDSEADNAAFATTCAPFNFAIVGDDVKAYAGKLSADGKELDMKEIEGNVPANQGVILKAAMGVRKVTVKVVNTADAIDNDLKGTNDEMTDLSQVYVFGRDKVTRHVGFYNASGDAALPANRAYLNKPAQEAVNAVAMNFGDGMVTNVNTAISAQSADRAPIYDLSGRRVQHTVKGSLYIKGGRKFMAQ